MLKPYRKNVHADVQVPQSGVPTGDARGTGLHEYARGGLLTGTTAKPSGRTTVNENRVDLTLVGDLHRIGSHQLGNHLAPARGAKTSSQPPKVDALAETQFRLKRAAGADSCVVRSGRGHAGCADPP